MLKSLQNTIAILLLLIAFSNLVIAQQQVFVNSKNITDIILNENQIYLSASEFADTIGAGYAYDRVSGALSLNYNGYILTANSNYIKMAGQSLAGTTLVNNNIVYLPLKSLAEAFGGSTYSEASKTYLLFPRAELLAFSLDSEPDYDRIILDFKNLSPFKQVYNDEINTLELIFSNVYEHKAEISYGQRTVMELGSSLGYLNLKLILSEASSYSIYNEATAIGHKLIIDIFAKNSATASQKKLQLLLKQNQIEETAFFVQEMSKHLGAHNILLETAIMGDTENGIDYLSEIFLAINTTNTTANSRNTVNIYYQSANPNTQVIRNNATSVLDRINSSDRQELLAKLANDYTFGQDLARDISDTILQSMGFQTNFIAEDLAILSDLAGRGVFIELSTDSLNNRLLINTIANAIIKALGKND